MKEDEWGWDHIGKVRKKSLHYTIGLFQWVKNKDGKLEKGPYRRYIVGFESDIPKIERKAEEACKKFDAGIKNRHIFIYADAKAKLNQKGDIPKIRKSPMFFEYLGEKTW